MTNANTVTLDDMNKESAGIAASEAWVTADEREDAMQRKSEVWAENVSAAIFAGLSTGDAMTWAAGY